MKKGITTTTLVILIVAIIAIAAVAYYFTLPPPPPVRNKVAIVSDIGGRGDLSFNDMAFLGAQLAVEEGLVEEIVEIISIAEADYLPNLRSAADRHDCVLIVGVGFLLGDAMKTLAAEYPDENFAVVDAFPHEEDSINPNALGILFAEQEGSALVGCLAALLAAHYEYPYVGMALGIEIPVLWHFEFGYKWGVEWALNWYEETFGTKAPVIGDTPFKDRVLWVYTGSFSDPEKGYEAAVAQFAQGAVAVFNVGGPIGLGIFRAAEEICVAEGKTMGPPFGIGVDADQDWIRPGFIIASMLKRVDLGVLTAIRYAVDGTFRDKVQEYDGAFTLALSVEGVDISNIEYIDTFLRLGVEAGTVDPADAENIKATVEAMRDAQPSWIWDAVYELKEAILNGEVEIPYVHTAEDKDYWRGIYG